MDKIINYKSWWIAYGVLSLADLSTTAYALIWLQGQEVNPLFSWLMGSIGVLLGLIAVAKGGMFLFLGKIKNGVIGKGWYRVSPRIIPVGCLVTGLVVVWNLSVILRH